MSSPAEMRVADAADLPALRAAQGLARVEIAADRLIYRNLLPHALKYGVWALAPGGELVLRHAAPERFDLQPHLVTAKMLRMWVFALLAGEAELLRLAPGEIALRRSRAPTPPGWGAGVVFSGEAAELPRLQACLEALRGQPGLQEIVVSGPAAAAGLLGTAPGLRYHAFESPAGPRLMIGRKKNDLIRAIAAPRVIVLHSRIRLRPGALGRVPAEFDILAPRVMADGQDYLSLGVSDAALPGRAPRSAGASLRQLPVGRYLELYARGLPYVDGGAFMLRKAVHARCPLNDAVAWDEVEDLEWCGRAVAAGLLVDLAPDCVADSAVNKLRAPALPEGLARLLRGARGAARATGQGWRHRAERLLGRR
jgi:hypothetical protein